MRYLLNCSGLLKSHLILISILMGLIVGGLSPSQAFSSSADRKATERAMGMVESSRLNLRSGPGTNHKILKSLPKGFRMRVLRQTSQWVKVSHWDGTQGWVFRPYFKVFNATDKEWNQDWQSNLDRSRAETAIKEYIADLKHKGWMDPRDHLVLLIEDLHTGEQLVSLDSQSQIKAASLIKVPILHAYMIQRFKGKVEHTAKRRRYLERMIQLSSNYSTNQILKVLGGPAKTQRILDSTGLYEDLKLVEYIPRNGRTYENKVSAADLNRLYRKIWNKQILGKEFSQEDNLSAAKKMLYYLGLPSGTKGWDRLKDRTCFAGDRTAKVYDKTGFVRGLNGDAGIIEINTPKGRRAYTFIGMIARTDYQTVPSNGERWARIQSNRLRRISEMTYGYMKQSYGAKTGCGVNHLYKYAGLQESRDNKAG